MRMNFEEEKKPYLSLCMIIRDAGGTIEKLLASVKGAFDEYIFVDTGSVDDTKERVKKFFEIESSWPTGEGVQSINHRGDTKIVLSSFKWIDDFAAARNYSFSLSSGRWVGYLDADDEFPLAQKLKKAVADVEASNPKVNTIVLSYQYEPGFLQDKFRWVKYRDDDGMPLWLWKDEIHEMIVATRTPRYAHKFDNLEVTHNQEREGDRLARNIRICTAVRERALAAGDTRKAALMSYYLGQYHSVTTGEAEKALEHFLFASNGLDDNNIACEVRVAAARLCLVNGAVDDALNWAALAVARTPEMIEGWAILGLAHHDKGDHVRAALAFDRYFTMPHPILQSTYDAVLLDAIIPSVAADSYTQIGRTNDAFATFSKIPQDLVFQVRAAGVIVKAFKTIQIARSVEAVKGLWENLIWNDEPMKAREILDRVPEAIREHPAILELHRLTRHRLRHIDLGWAEYVKCYGSLQPWTYDPKKRQHDLDWLRTLERGIRIRRWAAALPPEGPPVRVLAIGPQDCRMEHDMLAESKRIQLTVVDASELAVGAVEELGKDFPGQVTHRQMHDYYDWCGSDTSDTFDAIIMYEVIEHVPSDIRAIAELHKLLASDGTLFLSCPNAGTWTNTTLTTDKAENDWWGHVRANSPMSLWRKLRNGGFNGELLGTEHGQCLLAIMQKEQACPMPGNVAIFVPGTPTPFDCESHLKGHLGGSEEAVIYLSKALAKKGYTVTVFAPKPTRPDNLVIHGKDGVLWRDSAEFDLDSGNGADTVLFWRCPALMLHPMVKSARYKKLLWLHDTSYGAPREAYEGTDGIIVLSNAHAGTIIDGDCRGISKSSTPWRLGSNGIDLELFPELKEKDEVNRNPHLCVYGSSPDRGLDRVLKIWPRVRLEVPDAKLDIYYTWELVEQAAKSNPELAKVLKLREVAEEMKEEGVTVRGGVDQKTLAEAYRRAGLWVYPTSFPEISCITSMKVMAAGVEPCCTDTCALKETVGSTALSVWGPNAEELETEEGLELYAREVIRRLKRPMSFDERKQLSDAARQRFDWNTVAEQFAAWL
jgi:glycosyltransferase involved in cell wall biosynthesis/SAM-dependent methyltransferase